MESLPNFLNPWVNQIHVIGRPNGGADLWHLTLRVRPATGRCITDDHEHTADGHELIRSWLAFATEDEARSVIDAEQLLFEREVFEVYWHIDGQCSGCGAAQLDYHSPGCRVHRCMACGCDLLTADHTNTCQVIIDEGGVPCGGCESLTDAADLQDGRCSWCRRSYARTGVAA